jgi:hypothetical protein
MEPMVMEASGLDSVQEGGPAPGGVRIVPFDSGGGIQRSLAETGAEILHDREGWLAPRMRLYGPPRPERNEVGFGGDVYHRLPLDVIAEHPFDALLRLGIHDDDVDGLLEAGFYQCPVLRADHNCCVPWAVLTRGARWYYPRAARWTERYERVDGDSGDCSFAYPATGISPWATSLLGPGYSSGTRARRRCGEVRRTQDVFMPLSNGDWLVSRVWLWYPPAT